MFIRGMDFSSLLETERLGGEFSQDGKKDGLIEILARNGINAARLRLWNNPFSEKGEGYGAGGCDIETVIELARRAKNSGMLFMLDFHYSDFWADPGRQMIPREWMGKAHAELCEAVYSFTESSLKRLNSLGLGPDYIQIGNEITNGMLWPDSKLTETNRAASFDRLSDLLREGIRAARQNSSAKLIMHLEDSGNNPRWREWFDETIKRGVDFDIIGASYYPYWHGSPEGLKKNLDDMAVRYDKDVMVVETAYPFTAEHFDSTGESKNLVISDAESLADGSAPPWPVSKEGQRRFVSDMLSLVKSIANGRGAGLWYWEPAWLPVRGSTWATDAAREYIGEQDKQGGNEWANQCIFDYDGNANIALKEFLK